jgi:hypothetical protein
MKSVKYITLVGLLCAGLASLARADVNLIGTLDLNNASPAAELERFIGLGGDPDATFCAKIEDPDTTDSFITITENVTGFITVEFDLTGTGLEICGFAVKDGLDATNFFEVINGQGIKSPEGGIVLAVPGKGSFSHLTVFCCPTNGVPDSGTTAMLLGGALTGLGVVRRYLKR